MLGLELAAGDEVLIVVFVSDLVVAGEGFTIVVLCSVLAAGEPDAGVFTVSVFCSHAARSAAPARMQIYFFIFLRVFP